MGSSELKIIALDIDGVLNTRVDYDAIRANGRDIPSVIWYDHGDFVNKEKLAILQRIHAETGAVILGTSAWFLYADDAPKIAQFLQVPVISISRWNTGGGEGRAEGIRLWIDEHKPKSYVVFDDMTKGYESFNFGDNLFDTMASGLTSEMADIAIQILNGV